MSKAADEFIVLGYRRRQDHAEQFLVRNQLLEIVVERRRTSVAGPDNNFERRSGHRLENPALHADDVVRVRLVRDKSDQVRPPQGQGTGLRVRAKIVLGDNLENAIARFRLDKPGVIDDAGYRLLRHAGEARNVGDRELTAAFRLRRNVVILCHWQILTCEKCAPRTAGRIHAEKTHL